MPRRPHVLLLASMILGAWSRDAHAAERSTDQCIDLAERGQTDRAAGRLQAARTNLAECAREECPVVVRRDCAHWLADVEAVMPKVTFVILDVHGRQLTDATISVDGVVLAQEQRAHPLDPGPHDVEAAKPGYASAKKQVTLVASTTTVIDLRLFSLAGESPRSVEASPHPTTLSWGLTGASAGLAVAGLVIFGVAGGTAESDFNHLKSTCGTRCDPRRVDDVHTRYQVGDIGLVTGIAFAVGAAAIYLFGPRETR